MSAWWLSLAHIRRAETGFHQRLHDRKRGVHTAGIMQCSRSSMALAACSRRAVFCARVASVRSWT